MVHTFEVGQTKQKHTKDQQKNKGREIFKSSQIAINLVVSGCEKPLPDWWQLFGKSSVQPESFVERAKIIKKNMILQK